MNYNLSNIKKDAGRKNISLNGHYANFSAGLLDRKVFEVLVFNSLRREIRKIYIHGWRKEDYDDYMSWFYPKISRALKVYRETGSSFEAYIGTLMRMSIKEYRNIQAHNYATEAIAWKASDSGVYVRESEPEYGVNAVVDKSRLGKNPRQILILALKCSNYISTDFMEKISVSLGIEPGELNEMINCLKEDREGRINKIDILREKINRLYCRCVLYEKNIMSLTDETAVQRMKKKLELGRNRLEKMRGQLALMNPDPSSSQIARLLGISKSTVDSALHSLRKQYEQRTVING